MITIEVREEAEAEIREAFAWYEEKVLGLGHQFLSSVDAVLERIRRHARGFPVVERGTRKAILRRFPYVLLFFLDGSHEIVLAVYHGQRRPLTWSHRVFEPVGAAYDAGP